MPDTFTIRTVYVPATDTAGSRIRVRDTTNGARRERTYGYDYGASDPHVSAVARYAREFLGMEDPNISTGGTPYGRGYVFTLTTESE